MGELITIEQAITEKKRRMQTINTEQGQSQTRAFILGQFEYLRQNGYPLPEAEYRKMADTWCRDLQACIVSFGFTLISEAFRKFVTEDSRGFRQFPNVGQIIEKAKELGEDPEVRQAKMAYERLVDEMTQTHLAEVRQELTPERKEAIFSKFPKLREMEKRFVKA